jgi:hypothetical protein
VGVGDFVDERPYLRVRGSSRDDDLLALRVAPAVGSVVGQMAGLDGVAQFGGVGCERGDQVVVAVAADRLRGWREWNGLLVRERVGHADIEDRDGAEEDLSLAGVVAVCVALLDGHWGEDANRLLALADAAVELEEGAEAGDVGRGEAAGVTFDRDQHLVSEAVAREAVAGPDLDPASPAVAREEGAGGPLDAVAVSSAASVALLVGERLAGVAAGHRGLPCGSGPAPVGRADPAPPARPLGRAIVGVASRPARAGGVG